MVRRSLPLLCALVALAGCLQEGAVPAGRLLVHGQTLEEPGFYEIGGENFVRYVNRLANATGSKGGVYDLWLSSFDGSRQRKVLANWSDRWSRPDWKDVHDGNGYFWTDERTIPAGSGVAVVGSWVRLSATLEEQVRLEDVGTALSFYAPLSWIYANPAGQVCPGFPDRHDSCPQGLIERPPKVGQSNPTLYLWDGRYQIPIGLDAGGFQNQIMGSNGSIYCILGDGHTLSRLRRPQNQLDSLRDHVSSFQVSGDEHYVALTVTDDSKAKTVVRDLRTGKEVAPARPNPSAWTGFAGNVFTYAQNATSSSPAELHKLDLDTGIDTFTTLPPPLNNLGSSQDRPKSDERLRMDSLLHGLFTGKDDWVPRRAAFTGPLWSASFTPDGTYIIYIQRATSTLYDADKQGALMFQESDHPEQPPAMVSPAGLTLDFEYSSPYFFVTRDDATGNGLLAFWAHLGRASSDLYFADYQAGALPINLRLVAQSIMSVSVSPHNLFGILNVSQQDGVGDLVYRNLDTGTDTRYAQGVAEAAELQLGSDLSTTWAAYIVRGRADSDRSGLWLTTLASPDSADAGMN